MGIKEKIEEKIKKKDLEIQELESKIREAKSYIQALQDTLKVLPKEEMAISVPTESSLRPGGSIAKTLQYLKKTGQPMHISEILKGIGKPISKKERVSLSGSLNFYVKRNSIFNRPSPNTFGLVEWGNISTTEPPEDFGTDSKRFPEEDIPF